MNNIKPKFKTIDEYISSFEGDTHKRLVEFRKFIKNLIPDAQETISYQMPAFKLNGKGVVYFAAFKNHLGFYPFPSGVDEFKKLSSEYATSKGAIQFPYDKPIPYDLVEKIVKFRIEENAKK